MVAEKR